MTDIYLVLFDLKENKQVVKYFETEFEKDKEKRRIKKYLGRYLILEDSSDKWFLD